MIKRQPLLTVLTTSGEKLTPEALFKQCGFDDETVDEFFEELKREVGEGRILQKKTREGTWLRAAK